MALDSSDSVTPSKNGSVVQNPSSSTLLSPEECESAIENLCQLVRYQTVSSLAVMSGEYVKCANYLVEQLRTVIPLSTEESNNNNRVYLLPEAPDHSPVVVGKWVGTQPNLPVLLLNSHYDVVPATPTDWDTHTPPFDGIRYDSKIYGRGTQDMKCVCIQYIEALRLIRSRNPDWQPTRTLYFTFVPDEEVGGGGMAAFLDSKLYKEEILPIGIGLAIDEGLASETNHYSVFYGERLPWWINVTASGPTGHGSRFIEHTAVEQIIKIASKALEFREGQRQLLNLDHAHNCSHVVAAKAIANQNKIQQTKENGSNEASVLSAAKTLGDVTSLNVTRLEAGVRVGNTYAYNCVPPKAECSFDIRIAPHTPPSEISRMLNQWCLECSSNSSSSSVTSPSTLQWSYIGGHGNDLQEHAVTVLDDPETEPFYKVFVESITKKSVPSLNGLLPQVFPAATDSRFLRALGIRAFGFTPIRNTTILLHENNEYIPESIFIEGIQVYYHLIQDLSTFVS